MDSASSSKRTSSLVPPSFSKKSKPSNVVLANTASNEAPSPVAIKWKPRFRAPDPKPSFTWKPPTVNNIYSDAPTAIDPAGESFSCCELLVEDAFIDKSEMLYHLLKDLVTPSGREFRSVPLYLVYPRRFAKTTLLGFIEAVFSPVPNLDGHTVEQVKTKISSLQRGKELLDFGLHPVLSLDFQGIVSVPYLNRYIATRLGRAGLENFVVDENLEPDEQLTKGVKMLNEKFEAETGETTNTIVLIDEYDKVFRDKEIVDFAVNANDSEKIKKKKEAIAAILNIYSLGKRNGSGISLLILCGLTRIVGSSLSGMNNPIDVSRKTTYHGLCGISARELVWCAKDQFDTLTREQYGNQTFKEVLENVFGPKWNGFRFGLDDEIGLLDPNSPEGALFSPLDVWEIVLSLVKKSETPSSQWIRTMDAEFEFTSVAEKYKSPDGLVDLLENLEGGWVDANDRKFDNLKRHHYLLLKEELHVKKVLFELGLLSVTQTDGGLVCLRSPNDIVFENALEMLAGVANQGVTPQTWAIQYLSYDGFGIILSKAAKKVTNMYGSTGQNVVDEYTLQDSLYKELLYRFPPDGQRIKSEYQLLKEVRGKTASFDKLTYLTNLLSFPMQSKVSIMKEQLDMAVALNYVNGLNMVFIIEVKLDKIPHCDPTSITQSHQNNRTFGEAQVRFYNWGGESMQSQQKVVVSGVWHPCRSGGAAFEMSTEYWFLDQNAD